jgi:ATP phosphoribosyltransferase regulatory subunit HisZ
VRNLSRWPRVYQDQLVEPDVLLDDFDETITADLESTRRGMKALTLSGAHEAEFRAMQNKLVDALLEEVKEQRHELAKVVQSLNRKASKAALDDAAKSMREETAKRLDTIRNWAAIAIGVLTVTLALIRK